MLACFPRLLEPVLYTIYICTNMLVEMCILSCPACFACSGFIEEELNWKWFWFPWYLLTFMRDLGEIEAWRYESLWLADKVTWESDVFPLVSCRVPFTQPTCNLQSWSWSIEWVSFLFIILHILDWGSWGLLKSPASLWQHRLPLYKPWGWAKLVSSIVVVCME